MNILIMISTLSFGGAEKQAVIDANLLAQEHKVIIGSFKEGPLKSLLNSKVQHIVIKKDNYLVTAFRLVKIIKQNKIDVINASLFASMIISGLASFITRIPVVWHIHSHEYDIPLLSRFALKYVAKLHTVKKILFVNKELKEHFYNEYSFPIKKLGILYNASVISFSSKFDENKNSNIITIGYVGRLIKLKRVNYLMDLARFLKKNNIEFLIKIIGDGEERINLEQYAKNLKVDKQIKFYGFQSDTEKFYNNFDIFVLPSQEECLSLALIDAAMKGIPSVAFNVGGNNEIIVHGKTGFIVETKEEMFDKTLLLIKDKELRKKFGKEAHLYAMQHFSVDAHRKAIYKVYESFVA